MTDKFTPGPWSASEENCAGGVNVYAASGARIGHTNESARWATGGPVPESEALANAKLIAAAPELLQALRWYVENDETNDVQGNEYWIAAKKQAIDIISKATGEQT